MIQALVISLLDYYCNLLLGTKKANIDHLQHLQNSAVRFIFDIPQYENTKPYLQQLRWLPVQENIHFRILTYVFKGTPRYLSISQNCSRFISHLEILDPARNIDLINWSSPTDSVKKPSHTWAQDSGTILVIL